MSAELPDGWVTIRLGDICSKPQYGWTTSANKTSNGLKLLRTTDISAGIINWSSVPTCTEEPGDVQKYTLGPGDIVISRAGSVGLSYVIRDCPPAVFASYLIRFRPLGNIPSEFLGLFLQSPLYWLAVSEESAGIAVSNINASKLAELEVPLPPLAEQCRIVVKVEALLAEVKVARVRLAKVPTILKRFRQSVLAAACSGRLTEDWRDTHPQAQPLRLPELGEKRQPRGRRGANLSAQHELLIDDETAELPDSWIYARLDRLVAARTVITYGIVLPGPEVSGGVPYVRQQDIEDGLVRVSDLRHTTHEIAGKHPRSSLMQGDVLLCIIRNLRVAVVPSGLDGANITQGTVRIRPNSDVALGAYLAAYLASPQAQGWMKRRYFGMDMPRINVEDARAVPIAIPHVEEQREIVHRIEQLFNLADQIEHRVAAATARADKLTQAILAKAFRGELVPTEAELARAEGREYEPAALLLEKLRQTRSGNESNTKLGRNRLRKTALARNGCAG